MIGQRIDYKGVGVQGGQWPIPGKNLLKYLPSLPGLSVRSETETRDQAFAEGLEDLNTIS